MNTSNSAVNIIADKPQDDRDLFKLANTLWFVASAFGFTLFLFYTIIKFSQFMSTPETPLSFSLHIGFAIFIIAAGPVQLLPFIRKRWPAVHRWNGRIYMLMMVLVTGSGLYLLFDEDIGSWALKLGFVTQTLAILLCASLALKYAVDRNITQHTRWALRFFVVANIAFYYRIILVAWVMSTGSLGINMETGEGWFLDIIAIVQFTPLMILEAYFLAQKTANKKLKLYIRNGLYATSLVIFIGTILLSAGMWFPHVFQR